MTVNEMLRDALVHRAVGLVQYSNSLVRRVVLMLNNADSALVERLTTALENGGSDIRIERIERQLAGVQQFNKDLYARVGKSLSADLSELSLAELAFQGKLFTIIPPVAVPFTVVSPAFVYAAALARPFQGRLLSEWTSDLGSARMLRIRDAIRMGLLTGDTVGDMVRKVRGTRALAYGDGIISVDRRNAEALVRTAVSHTVSVARENVYSANADVVKAVQWVSTLDARTSDICMAHDGLTYTVDTHKPIGHSLPWLGGPGQAHWNCRSSSVPVFKSMKELGIDLPELPVKGTRASMDGQVSASMNYAQWFAKQSAARQDQIVGPTRGKLFRNGAVDFSNFTNDKGRTLTLAELAAQQ